MTAVIEPVDTADAPKPPEKEDPIGRLRREALRRALSALPARYLAAGRKPTCIRRPMLMGPGGIALHGWELTRSFILTSDGRLFQGSMGVIHVDIASLSETSVTRLEASVETLGIMLAT